MDVWAKWNSFPIEISWEDDQISYQIYFFFNTIVFTMLININVVNIIHLWRLINRIWPINGAASTPAVQTVWSVVEMKALNFYGVSTDWCFSAAKTSRSVYLGEKVERQLFCPAPRLLACQRTGKHSALWRRPKKVSATFLTHRASCSVRWDKASCGGGRKNWSLPFSYTELLVSCAGTRQAVELHKKLGAHISTHGWKRLHCWVIAAIIYTLYTLR